MKKHLLSIFALMLMTAVGAVAQTETLLTTITATAKEQASYSTANVATVSFSYTAGGSSAYLANWGWWGYGWSATVTAAEGYTITKCIFYDDANRTATDTEAPFVVETTEEDKTPQVNGTPILVYTSKGIKKIDVYGYVTSTATQYAVTLADGTDDATTLPRKAQAMLYGSQARGDARADSDWDILIVLDKLLPADYDTITYPLTKLGWELGTAINPVMYTKKEWEANRITPFYHNVVEDAIAL